MLCGFLFLLDWVFLVGWGSPYSLLSWEADGSWGIPGVNPFLCRKTRMVGGGLGFWVSVFLEDLESLGRGKAMEPAIHFREREREREMDCLEF